MALTTPWRVVYFQSEDGNIPFLDFIDKLDSRLARAECYAFIELLETRGGSLMSEKVLTHPYGVQEICGRSVRIFYVFTSDSHIVIIDGLFLGQSGQVFDDILRKA